MSNPQPPDTLEYQSVPQQGRRRRRFNVEFVSGSIVGFVAGAIVGGAIVAFIAMIHIRASQP